MSLMIVDPVTEAELSRVQQTLELSGKSGRILGFFVPAVRPADAGRMEPNISEEELRRREEKGVAPVQGNR